MCALRVAFFDIYIHTHEHTIHSYIVLFIVHAQTYKQASTHTHRNAHTHTHTCKHPSSMRTPHKHTYKWEELVVVVVCERGGRGQTDGNGSRGKEIMKIKENFKAIANSLLHFQYCTYTFHSFSLIIIVFQFQFHCTIHIQKQCTYTHTQALKLRFFCFCFFCFT